MCNESDLDEKPLSDHIYHYRRMDVGLKQLTDMRIRLARAPDYQKGDPMDTNPSTMNPDYCEDMRNK